MRWVKSSTCDSGGCVEVNRTEGSIYVRSTQHENRMVWFTPEEWKRFIEGAKRGEFDI
jgi:hypothetical protein